MGSSPESIDHRIAARVRALRVEKSLTLDGLARASSVSRAMLSRIERGESSPTAQVLLKVCSGLGVTLSALFAATERSDGSLSRHADQAVWRDPATGYTRRAVTPANTGSPIEIVEVVFPAGHAVTFDNHNVAAIDQQIWLLDGMLDIVLAEETTRLVAGDCLATRFDRPITFRNISVEPARYAVVLNARTLTS